MPKIVQNVFKTVLFVLISYAAYLIVADKVANLSESGDKVGSWLAIAQAVLFAFFLLSSLLNSIVNKLGSLVVSTLLIQGVVQIAITCNSFINNQITKTSAFADILFTTVLILIFYFWMSQRLEENKEAK